MNNIVVITTESANINAILASLFNKKDTTIHAFTPPNTLPPRITLPPDIEPERKPTDPAHILWIKHFGHKHITALQFTIACKTNPELYQTFTPKAPKSTTGITAALTRLAATKKWLQIAREHPKDKAGSVVNHYWAT